MARVTKAQRRAQKQREAEERRRAEARRKRIRFGLIGGGAAIVLVALLVALWPSPEVGNTTAEAWDLPALDHDGRVRLADFRGTPLVAAFYASWCEVCEVEIPQFLAISERVDGEVQFVGIDMQDSGRGLPDAEKWGIAGSWPLARDIGNGNGSGLSTTTFGMRGSPMTVFYDEDGKVLQIVRGGMTGDQLVQALERFYGVSA